MQSKVTDRERFEFETRSWQFDYELRSREIAVKEREQSTSKWRSPIAVAIIAAAVAATGNAAVALINGNQQVAVEQSKAESARILEMLKTGDPDKAAKNLEFLLQAGLISDPDRAALIKIFLANRPLGTGPALPSLDGKVLFEQSDAMTADLNRRLEKTLVDYVAYLERIGVNVNDPVNVKPASVKIEPLDPPNTWYIVETNQIIIDPSFAVDPTIPIREFNHHILVGGKDWPSSASSERLESGLADYLSCSFLNTPYLGGAVAQLFTPRLPYLRNMDNARNYSEFARLNREDVHSGGEIWGGALWEIRSKLQRDVADPALISAWRRMTIEESNDDVALDFVTSLLMVIEEKSPSHVEVVRAVFSARGFPLPPRT